MKRILFIIINVISYTINEGASWQNCSMGPHPFVVDNIRVDNGLDTRQFILYGSKLVDGASYLVLYHLDFDKAYTKKCTTKLNNFFSFLQSPCYSI